MSRLTVADIQKIQDAHRGTVNIRSGIHRVSTKVHLMICAGTSCVASGSLKVRDALSEEIQKKGLQEEVFLATTGCNGFCAAGPLMIVSV